MLGEYRITGRGASGIAADIERAVGEGALKPGAPLPPLRELAQELDVNPNTVAAAYRLLRDRGVIETAGRRGSRVRSRPATTSRDQIRIEVPPGVRDISQGNPDVALLPPLKAAFAAALDRNAEDPALYGGPAVDAELDGLARAAFDRDGVPDGPIGLTSGSLDAIERVLTAHLRPGDAVAVEDPGWGSVLDLVPAVGLRAVPVGVDDDGPVVADVARALRDGARALVVTDRGQNPTGAAISADRARELRAVLVEYPQVLVVDDDHVHGLVDLPLHCLSGVTTHWALVRSTAKAYGPDLRLAVFTGDPVTVDRVQGRYRLGAGWVSHLLQRAVVHLWESGAVDPRRVARSYGRRRDALVLALADRGIAAHGRSGMNVWVPVSDETGAVAGLLQAGWATAPGARFRLASAPGVRLTVSAMGPDDIVPLADAVARVVGASGAGRYG
ncbi:aminotransferase class I/II-fold pyridoxal phosphate-dependent enzyme [Streptomyces sp. H10-C2]|uniref:aminotransferase class I/II-fold pyridoxal phosphate-dependent enzyme n=1 Tax=unclassified Streptomyces TaxID=2593676 RepID=UPI0024B8F237|nr:MULTISPECIES: aminotransferase class I/II-fold pyridoxal phosphate-dependent enzyme [unclassified Streptomyces]MDJ0343098.1 aminotransferase class I/II-fold pyridoxal phosphate-dependent enzyme [Streptomyces sp. PH10-H1]MDJ0372722.1 aminotransferase class I/II-fold pyridoxal phosphate-dependent enzyme [Streptomyces sp. H10-C2]